MREDNPCQGVERNQERKRHALPYRRRNIAAVGGTAALPDQGAANAVRLLLLTGARRGEVRSMQWQDVDLGAGTWTKPHGRTKQKERHPFRYRLRREPSWTD